MKSTGWTIALFGAAALLAPERAEAIPAFARKYQLSCTTCHAPFPRLKPYGEEFAGRGFRMEEASKEPTRATLDLGDPLLRLPRDFPLAARLDGYAAWKEDAVAETDVEWPWAAKVLSGGPITQRVSYYVYAILEKGESLKLEDTWVQFNDVWDIPLDIQVGQFQVCDPLFKRELRLERSDYDIFKTHVGDAVVDLTYDRGVYLFAHAPASVDLMVGVVNGNGIDAASEFDDFDKDDYKNVALRIVRPFGPVRLGVFGYAGKERGGNGLTNETTYVGPDIVADLGDKVQIGVEYLERRDDDPWFHGAGSEEVKTRGGFFEIHVFPKGQDGRWALTALYNKVDSDEPTARTESASLTLNWLMARNLRLMAEGRRNLATDRTTASIGLVTAF